MYTNYQMCWVLKACGKLIARLTCSVLRIEVGSLRGPTAGAEEEALGSPAEFKRTLHTARSQRV